MKISTKTSDNILAKSHIKSRIIRCHATSKLSKSLLGPSKSVDSEGFSVTVLQVMHCDNNELIVEYVRDEFLNNPVFESF